MKKIILLATMALTLTGWIAHRTDIDVGRVLNNDGDGKLYNGESFYNYIYYPPQFKENDIVLTVCLLNPLNNYCDDIIIRQDFRLLQNI